MAIDLLKKHIRRETLRPILPVREKHNYPFVPDEEDKRLFALYEAANNRTKKHRVMKQLRAKHDA